MAANAKDAGKRDVLIQQISDFFNAKNLGLIDGENGQFYLGYQSVGQISQLHVFYDFDEITIEENGDYKSYNLRELVEKELLYKKALQSSVPPRSYHPPRIVQFGMLLKDEIYSILSQHRFALPGSIDGERVRQHKIATAYEGTHSSYFKIPDEFTEVALMIAELESVDDIFAYINDELEKDEKTARFTQALYEIKIAVFHKMIDKEGRYYKLVEFLRDINQKIEETKGQEIQSKWQELKDHLYYRIKFVAPGQYKNILMNIAPSPTSSSSEADSKVNQAKESKKSEAKEDKTNSSEMSEEAEYLLLLKRNIYKTLTKYNESKTKESQDNFARVALKVSELHSAKEIYAYFSQEIRACRNNASLSFFSEALSDIRILAFHEIVEHEFLYDQIKSSLDYVKDKIENTEDQEIQSKWKALREHMITKMKAEEQAVPQSISEYSAGYFASRQKSSISATGKEIISGLRRRILGGN